MIFVVAIVLAGWFLGFGLHFGAAHAAVTGKVLMVGVVACFLLWRLLAWRSSDEEAVENGMKWLVGFGLLPFAIGAFIGALWTIVG